MIVLGTPYLVLSCTLAYALKGKTYAHAPHEYMNLLLNRFTSGWPLV